WRVEASEGAVSHLFGTIHSEDARVTELAEPVAQAFDSAETVMLEMELTPTVQQQMAQAIMLPPAQQLSDFLPQELFQASISAMAERGYPEQITARLRPWAVLLTLSMPQPKTGEFLDKVLHDRAIAEGKTVMGLESLEEQLAIFRDLPLADQRLMLEQALKDHPRLPEMLEAMTSAWLQRDLGRLMALYQESMAELPPSLQQAVGQRLLQGRNQRMAERALEVLQQGGAFIAVGALHLPGEEGLVALLRERGMTLTPVY
ncbi:MAG TPA: TraB/GumN family protein, partial [Gammaproteobacteria bacterium]